MENDLERLRWLAVDSSGNDIQVRVSDMDRIVKPIDEDSCKVRLNNGDEVTVFGSYNVIHDQLAKWQYVNRVCSTYDDDIFKQIECRRKALRKNKQNRSSKDDQEKRLQELRKLLADK